MEKNAKPSSLKQQSAWLLAAKVVAFSFSFFLPLIIVRSLAQDVVGHYREAFQVITNAVIILPLGFSMSAYYYLSRETERRAAAVLNILIFNFFAGGLAAFTLLLFPDLIGGFTKSPELNALGPTIGILIWVSIFAAFLEIVAIANSEAKVATVFITVSALSKTILMGSAVVVFASVEAIVYAALIQAVLQSALLLNYVRSRFPGFWREFDAGFFAEQARYAIPFGLTSILWIAQTDIHNYFVMYKFDDVDFAIYAYGCFQLPLISMLAESVASVLIPHMNTLQKTGDKDEMIRLTVRAMEKLSFFYFPLYAFLMITAGTFITTLFTHKYDASTPIFMINLTILPFSVLLTDPIVRSFKELGRFFLLTRVFVLALMVAILYFSLSSIGMVGIIAIAVGAILLEKFIGETMIIKKLGIGLEHLPLLRNVGKTAVISLIAGAVTYVVYANVHVYLEKVGEHFAEETFHTQQMSTLNFFGGALVLLLSGLVFAPIYLLLANIWGVIEESEKQFVRKHLGRFLPKGWVQPVADSQG